MRTVVSNLADFHMCCDAAADGGDELKHPLALLSSNLAGSKVNPRPPCQGDETETQLRWVE